MSLIESGPFLLAVGTIEPRKNLAMLLDVLKAVDNGGEDLKLVVAGRKGWLSGPFFDRLRDTGMEDRVVLTGPLADEALASLYGAARMFLFPSLYEGFGLPGLEAMACGTPVVCSNVSSLPEVAGDAAILLPPLDTWAWVEAIRGLLSNAELQRNLIAKGIDRAKGFTWEKTAERTWDVYERVYERCC